MYRIIQISDLHLLPNRDTSLHEQIIASFFDALEHEIAHRGPADLIVFTGDLFDSATADLQSAIDTVDYFILTLYEKTNSRVPIVMIPGNHDRRKDGVMGANRIELWDALVQYAQTSSHPLWVQHASSRFHAHVVPRSFHKLPCSIIAYDSTWVHSGYFTAGGNIRKEDLLYAFSQIFTESPDTEEPVLLLVHHHIVPTPQTDLGKIETQHLNAFTRKSFEAIVPSVFGHADHEEHHMTALGAGTALSTLHSFGRPVIVMHGHKHIASSRLLIGTKLGQGDVAVVGAGSAGSAQVWSSVATQKPVHLWPSFNLIEMDKQHVMADAVTFGYKGSRQSQVHIRPLLSLQKRGNRFEATPVDIGVRSPGPQLKLNYADYTVYPSSTPGRLDVACVRLVQGNPEDAPKAYHEPICIYPGAQFSENIKNDSLLLPLNEEIAYWAKGSFANNAETLQQIKGTSSFEFVSLFNRYQSEEATLLVRHLPSKEFFATAQDLGSGDETRVAVERLGPDTIMVTVSPCPPRTLIRLYFPVKGKHELTTDDSLVRITNPDRVSSSAVPQQV